MAPPRSRGSGPFRPTRLGQWEVVAKIAGGGIGAVYLGRRADPDAEVPSASRPAFAGSGTPSDRSHVVALKIVRHDVAKDERLVKMFLEEGKLLARLVHPNIVRTLEVGCDAEQDFIAMELMLGKTFAAIHDALVTRGVRLNPEIAAWTAARICDALHYAHELTDDAGRALALVHRDVNPANVFATFDGQVKLFDFGLAKVTAGDASGSQMLAGKLSYLSPEQIMQMPLDRRSDVFSLGTTLWELLTSRRLFRRESDVDTVRAVQLGPIPDPRAVAPEVPEKLARIAKTALERNRDHRYPTAAHLARELDAWVFARTSPADVAARLAQLVDTLFPGEHKRQSGWLKPAITSSSSRTMPAVAPTPRPGSISRPAPPEVRRDSHETTAVMPHGPAMSSTSIPVANTLPDGIAAATTARDGVPAAYPPSSSPTSRGAAPPARPPALPSAAASTTTRSVPAARPLAPPAAPSARASWPAPSQRPPAPQPSRPPGPRSFPTPAPTSRTEVQAMPPVPDSRTEVQRAAPTIEKLERAPVPLPSRARPELMPPRPASARKPVAEPPDSEPTQVDVPQPPDRRR